MGKKVDKFNEWYSIYGDELKTSVKLLFPLIIVIFLFGNLEFIAHKIKLTQFDSETYGRVSSIEKIKAINESEAGSKLYTKFYKINYDYQLGDKTYGKEEYLSRKAMNIKGRIKMDKLEKGDSIIIKYDSQNHSKSIIKFH